MKTAVVTGAAQGVGLVTASLLVRLGYRVVLTDLQALDAQVAKLRVGGGIAEGINGVSLPVDGGWTADISWESLRVRTRNSEP